MPLNEEQEAKVRAYAQKNGLDEEKLVEEANKIQDSGAGQVAQEGSTPDNGGPPSSSTEKPKLFQYHLPFVTVKEVRQNWLGLTDSFPGDNEVAAEWAAKYESSAESTTPEGG